MGQRLSMATRHEGTKKYAKEYGCDPAEPRGQAGTLSYKPADELLALLESI